jgi:hypothetical protein
MNQVQPVRTVPQHIFVANFLLFSLCCTVQLRRPPSRWVSVDTRINVNSVRSLPLMRNRGTSRLQCKNLPLPILLLAWHQFVSWAQHILFPQTPSNAKQFASSINQFSFDWLHQCRGSGKPDLYEMFNKISFNRPDQSFSSRIF